MSAALLEGAPVAEQVLRSVRTEVARLVARGIQPGLGTILVGDDAASAGYVRKKHEACEAAGLRSYHRQLPATATQEQLLKAIADFNADANVHGFLLQHPLPSGLDFAGALLTIAPEKDADGLHPMSIGKLALGLPGPVAATPAGIREMLLFYGIATSGRSVVIIGRGPTLGRPLSLLLSQRGSGGDAAVTVLHSAVPNLASYTRNADIVIAGVGQPSVVTADMIKPGAVAISAGITWRGRRILPDVDEAAAEQAAWMTPRLGGVGVTTVAMLLANTVRLAAATVG